jgi:hypothetical protein
MPGALYPQMAMPYFTPTVGMGMHMGYAPSLSPYTAGLYAPPPQPALHMPTHTPHHAPALHAAAYYPQVSQCPPPAQCGLHLTVVLTRIHTWRTTGTAEHVPR